MVHEQEFTERCRRSAAEGGGMPEVEVRELTKTFGRVTALREMSFTAPAGKVTGFLGPNGSGKTTTLRVVLGLDRAGIAWLAACCVVARTRAGPSSSPATCSARSHRRPITP